MAALPRGCRAAALGALAGVGRSACHRAAYALDAVVGHKRPGTLHAEATLPMGHWPLLLVAIPAESPPQQHSTARCWPGR